MNNISAQQLQALLSAVDAEFTPRLSTRLNLSVYATKLIANASLFSVSCNGQLTAVCAVYANDKIDYKAYLTILAVLPVNRGAGIARRLISQAESELQTKGFKSLALEVYRNNYKALTLYQKCGFIQTDVRGESLILTKRL